MRVGAAFVTLVIASASCGGAAVQPADPTQAPALVRIELHDAIIGPSKANGMPWDGTGGRIAAELAQGVAAAMSVSNPYTAAAAALANLTAKGIEPPDVAGWADIDRGAGWADRVTLLMNFRDSFNPSWGSAAWDRVPWNHYVRLRIFLVDQDAMFDDPIGTIELGWRPLSEALASGKNYPVRVDDQTHGQVLFVGISVAPE
jgi:hypothetical protein